MKVSGELLKNLVLAAVNKVYSHCSVAEEILRMPFTLLKIVQSKLYYFCSSTCKYYEANVMFSDHFPYNIHWLLTHLYMIEPDIQAKTHGLKATPQKMTHYLYLAFQRGTLKTLSISWSPLPPASTFSQPQLYLSSLEWHTTIRSSYCFASGLIISTAKIHVIVLNEQIIHIAAEDSTNWYFTKIIAWNILSNDQGWFPVLYRYVLVYFCSMLY